MNKILLTISPLFFSASLMASNFAIRVPTTESLSNWSNAPLTDSSYGEWIEAGAAFNCLEWLPLVDTVDSGQSFQQTATCSQVKKRTITNRKYDSFSKNYKIVNVVDEEQTLPVNQVRLATGSKVTGFYTWFRVSTRTIVNYMADKNEVIRRLNAAGYTYNARQPRCSEGSVGSRYSSGSLAGRKPPGGEWEWMGGGASYLCKWQSL